MPTSAEHVSTYDVLVNGTSIDKEHKDRLKEVRIVDHVRLPDVCTLKFSYPMKDMPNGNPPPVGIDTNPFEIAAVIEVKLGPRFKREPPTTLFKGEVVTLEPEFGGGGCTLIVRAYDKSHRLHRSRNVRVFQNQTASDIVQTVAGEYGLSCEAEGSDEVYEFMQQDNETDWDFLWRLAERAGFEVLVEDVKLLFRKPAQESAVQLTWPDHLISFHPRLTAVQQVKEVTLLAHDPKTKRVLEARAASPEQIAEIGIQRSSVANAFPDAKMHVATEPVKTLSEGTQLATALLNKLANGYIAAEGVAHGDPRIKAGVMVDVEGVGERFGGKYRIATTTHVLRGGGRYETVFANSPTHTILGAVGGDARNGAPDFGSQLVLGIVTNNNDPDGMGRVRVKYPALGDSYEGAWARIASVSSGNERGVMMLPQPDEEVLIGFEHGDTTRPYVLGSLFNGRDLPKKLEQNKDGSFAVMSNEKIHLESKKDTEVTSIGKLIIEVTDNVEEKYKKDWTNDTTGKATLKATQAFSVEGQSVSIKSAMQNVEIKGAVQVSIEGTAGVTLKCGGSQIQLMPAGVTISGPLINIG
jgi:phage protein D